MSKCDVSFMDYGLQCTHEAGHDGPHRDGTVCWSDPFHVEIKAVEQKYPLLHAINEACKKLDM